MKQTAIICAVIVMGLIARPSHASLKEDVKKGNVLYNKALFSDAAKAYEEAISHAPDGAIPNFNMGDALFMKTSYDRAMTHYNKAIAASDHGIIALSDYNIGNVYYRLGAKSEATDIKKTQEQYETALKFYKRSLDLNPGDHDAKFNYEFVSKRIAELKEPQKKQDEQKQQQKQQQKQDQKDQKDQQDQQNQQNQQNQQDKQNRQDQKDQQQQQPQQDQSQGGGGGQKEQQDKSGSDQKQGEEEKKPDEKDQQESQGEKGSEQQKSEQQKSEQQKSEQQKPEEKNEGGKESEEQGQKDKQEGGLEFYDAPQKEQEAGEMTEKEAKMLLDGYKGEEATGKTVRLQKKNINVSEPTQDW